MTNKVQKLWKVLLSPNGGLVYANRLTVLVCLMTDIIDVGLLFFNITTDGGRQAFDLSYLYSSNATKYLVVLLLLFMGGVVWSINSKLDERMHTVIIIGVMFVVLQTLFLCIGTYAFAANFILIFLTVIYANPLLTLVTGLIVFLISLVNFYTAEWLSKNPAINTQVEPLSEATRQYFLDSMLFYLPMIMIVAIMVSFCLRQLFRYNREYSNAKTLMETNNKAAALIQQQILESSRIDDTSKENVAVYPFLKMADYVAGDFYDYYNIDRNNICFMVADVSGKGIAAGLFMVRAKEVLKVIAKDHLDPAQVLERANNLLCDNNEECMFATAWLGVINLKTGVVNYSNAGHTAPVLISKKRVVALNEVSGPMLGLFADREYKSHSVKLAEGDRILLYTDGVTEQPIDDDKRYDEKGLLDFIKKNTDRENLCEAIYSDIERYDKKQFDDITMLQLNLNHLKSSTSKVGKEIDKHCYLAANPKSIRTVRKLIVGELEDSNVSKDVINTFYVACEEMITNIIKYAYGSPNSDGGFILDFKAEDDYLAITIKDTGVAFNPFLYDNSVYANKESGITEGGRGIKIFTEIMDEYSYTRDRGKNVVNARKYI